MDPSAYPTAQALLDELFVQYLQHKYLPLSYGEQWLLLEESTPRDRDAGRHFSINPKRVLAPWRWLTAARPTAIADIQPAWLSKSPSAYGLVAHSMWRMRGPLEEDSYGTTMRQSSYGLATNDPDLLDYIMTGPGKQPHPVLRAGFLKVVEVNDHDVDAYRHRLVVLDAWSGRPFGGRVLRETGKPFDATLFKARDYL